MNMWSMCVTLEVSKVNGWSNADACCRKSNGGNMMRGELRAGRRQVAARATASKQRAGEESSAGSLGHGRGAHEEHAVHDCDAGGVEAQRLVERGRALPSPKAGMLRGRQAGQETGGRGGGGLSDARRGPDWWVGGTGRRGAHLKHVLHVRDAGRVEAQRLVELIRVLPGPKGGMGSGRYAKPGGRRPGWLKEALGGHPDRGLGRCGAAPQTFWTCS